MTESAGFNDLVQMETPIVDGATLGSNFLIYSSDQVWQMEFVGGSFIFNFRKLFDDAGVMGQNCIVEVEGKHYVFDFDDIYITDGTQESLFAMVGSETTFSTVSTTTNEANVLFCIMRT